MGSNRGRAAAGVLGCLSCLLAAGCGGPQLTNPSLPATTQWADRDLKRMAREPRRLERPLVVIGGYLDPGFGVLALHDRFAAVTKDPRIATLSMFDCWTFEACRQKVIDVVGRAFPSEDPRWTTEVDVVGYSMGGLVARLAAAPSERGTGGKRLRIRRLFTIDSPNHGANRAAELPILLPLQAEMRPGSAMLDWLNAQPRDYAAFTYVRLNDKPIGPRNAAIDGAPLWWVSTPPFSNPHTGACDDPRILVDIARRLRGEMPLSSLPAAPLPPTS